MTEITQIPDASADSSKRVGLVSDEDDQWLAFLEQPAADIAGPEIGSFDDVQIQQILDDLRVRNQKPGESRRRLKEESSTIKTKKPSKRKQDTSVFDALV